MFCFVYVLKQSLHMSKFYQERNCLKVVVSALLTPGREESGKNSIQAKRKAS